MRKNKRKESRKQTKNKVVEIENKFDSEILAAKEALHEAAKALADLTREEPQILGEEKRTRTIHVYPTGVSEEDISNLERAITDAGPGWVVVLKAMDKTGRIMAFNLSKVDELFMVHEVTLKSEKNAVMRFTE